MKKTYFNPELNVKDFKGADVMVGSGEPVDGLLGYDNDVKDKGYIWDN